MTELLPLTVPIYLNMLYWVLKSINIQWKYQLTVSRVPAHVKDL